MTKYKNYLYLYAILLLYSIGTVCSKYASLQPFLSLPYLALYGAMILILLVYAVIWQQVLKYIPLTVAYSNKSILIILGLFWGYLLFGEPIKWNMIVGSVIIFAGLVMVVKE